MNTYKMTLPIIVLCLVSCCLPVYAHHMANKLDKALVVAVATQNIRQVRHLLSQGASASVRNNYGESLLMVAAGNEDEATVTLLLAHGAQVNARGSDGRTALVYSAMARLSTSDENDFESQGDMSKDRNRGPILRLMGLLIAHGANVDAAAKDGRTPLMFTVAFTQSPSCTRLLLEHGANVQAKDKNGMSVLDWAVWGSQKDGTEPDDAQIIVLLKQRLQTLH